MWKDIINYEGLYKINENGIIVSIKRNIKKKSLVNHKGYRQVLLCKNGKKKCFKIHRLVALHFIKIKENKKKINHKDGNKLNNYYKNLEWCTHKENEKHAKVNGLKAKGEKHGMSKLKNNQILKIRELCNKRINKHKIAEQFNISLNSVYRIKNKISWSHV